MEKVLAFIQSDDRLKGLRRIESPVTPEDEAIHHGQHGHSASSPLAAGEDVPFRWDHVRVKLKKEVTFTNAKKSELLCYKDIDLCTNNLTRLSFCGVWPNFLDSSVFCFHYMLCRLSLLGCLLYRLLKGLENMLALMNGIL